MEAYLDKLNKVKGRVGDQEGRRQFFGLQGGWSVGSSINPHHFRV